MLATLEVNLEALRANALRMRDLVAPSKLAGVVKANAYGHGIVEVALAIESIVSRLCVYSLEEAVALRDGGITAPILIMGPISPVNLPAAHESGAAIALWDTGSYVLALATIARRRHSPFPVHMKVNTGVARLGLSVADATDAIEDFLHMPELSVQGVFSHLANAEELDSSFTLAQLSAFDSALAPVRSILEGGDNNCVAHIAASAAAMMWPQTRLDMVRVGIALYGLWPSAQTQDAMLHTDVTFQPALSFKSELVATQHVRAGEPVGYGGSYHASTDTTIGIVPVGYAEGVPRALSNRASFVLNGRRCPVVGRICMNMTMIDVTDVLDARPGSVVTLIGNDGNQSVTADDWANWAGTINYEIVTRLPSELPRTYQ
ncbi:MAG: alanine racemase [Candidatus Eremiobacteraeota bacterium]|nr:alanine racemase [Candidatus Eremiobacteraeota bacterium]